nr:MAG TPA: RapA N-terminal Tudor like domain 1 [Caudoviricetes sp.]
MRQFRKGDIVTIECVVESQFADDNLRVRPVEASTDIYVTHDQVKIVRQVLKAGDRVTNTELPGIAIGTVLSIAGDRAWVECDDGIFTTWFIRNCCRAETSEQSEDA